MAGRPDTAARAIGGALDRLVRGGLRGVWMRGTMPVGPTVWAANHHSWWDAFVAAAVLRRAGRPAALLMEPDNLARFGFLRRLGVLGTDQPRAALATLRAGGVVIVYPEGELRPPGALGDLAPGAAWLGRQAPATVLAVAVRVVLRGAQHPEAYLHLGAVPPYTESLTAALVEQLAGLDTAVATTDVAELLPGFRPVVTGRHSWDERLARWAGWIPGSRRWPLVDRPARTPDAPVSGTAGTPLATSATPEWSASWPSSWSG